MSLVVDNLNISEKELNKWVIASPYCSIIINKELFALFNILKESETLVIASKSFNSFFNNELSFEQFTDLVLKHFGGRGFLKDDEVSKQSKSYVNFKIDFISKKVGIILSNIFGFLFNLRVIYFVIILITIGIIMIIYKYHFEQSKIVVFDMFYSFIAINISLLFHEIGHITAYNYFLKKENLFSFKTSGQIGFGFYFIFPVYYSNVTQAWSLDTRSRIIVNLAGIYFQLLFAISILLIALIFDVNSLIIPAYSIIIHSIFSLNPFIRSDGYWILSDLTDTHNLLSKSKLALREFIKNPVKERFNWKVLYSAGNYVIFIILTVNILMITRLELFYFPRTLFDAISNIIVNQNYSINISSFWIYYIYIYLITISFFIKLVKKKILGYSVRKKL